MHTRFFFATLADLEPNIRRAEELFSVKYTPYFHGLAGTFPTTYNSALDIPDFGVAKELGLATANECIWVTPNTTYTCPDWGKHDGAWGRICFRSCLCRSYRSTVDSTLTRGTECGKSDL
jgi:hypothetical protein